MPVTASMVYAASLHQRIFGQEVVNTFAFRVENVGTQTDEAAFLEAIFGDDTGLLNVVAGVRTLLTFTQTPQVTHEKWRVNRVYPDLSQPYDFPILTRNVGVIPGDCETANVAMCVSRRGAGGGRNQVGRVAFAGQPASFRSEGKWTQLAINAGNLAGAQMVGTRNWGVAIGTVHLGFYVGKKKGKDGAPDTPGHFVPCVTATARPEVRVQRSRTVNRGS